MAASASSASPSSSRLAESTPRPTMLGRTDSRRRLLFLLVVFGVGSMALVTRTVYWQVLRGDELTARAAEQTAVRIEIGGRRGDIYDRTGTVLLATSVARDRLIAAADQLTPVPPEPPRSEERRGGHGR